MQNLRPFPDLLKPKCHFHKNPGESGHTLKCGKHCPRGFSVREGNNLFGSQPSPLDGGLPEQRIISYGFLCPQHLGLCLNIVGAQDRFVELT